MPIYEPETVPVEAPPEPIVRPRSLPQEQTETKRQPPYAVVLHNDDINGFDFVIGVLRKVFHYGGMKAFWLTLKAHITGRAIVWTGSLEVAELRSDQIRACGPDPNMKSRGALPLRTTVEEMPD